MMLILIFVEWLVGIIVLFKLSDAMNNQKKKETAETKTPFWNKIPRWVYTIIVILVFYLFMTKGLRFIVNKMNDRDAKQEAKIEQIEADYEDLHEDNFDETTGKTILTQEFLKKEYRIFHEEIQQETGFMMKIGIIGLFLIIGCAIIFAVQNIIGTLYKKDRSMVKSLIFLLIPTALLVAGIITSKMAYSYEMPLSPKKVETIEVYAVTARKYEYEHETEDSTDIEHYVYIDFGDGNGEVRYTKKNLNHLFRTIDEPGRYYLARAVANGKTCDFMCFAEDKYISEEEV
jgi:hypothetical protein